MLIKTHASLTIQRLLALLLVLMVVSYASAAQAQFSVTDTYLPDARIKRGNQTNPDATIGMNIVDVAAELPLYVSEDKDSGSFTVLANEWGFRHHHIGFSVPAGEEEYFPKNLYAATTGLVLAQSFSQNWYGVGFGTFGIASDFNNVDAKHLYGEGGAFVVYKVTEGIHLGAGPVFTYAFGNPVLIPAPFVRMEGEGKLSFELKFPRYARLRYAFSDSFDVSLVGRSLYNNYRLGHESAQLPDGSSTTIVFSDLTLGAEASLRLYKPLFLVAGGGAALSRKFFLEDDDQKKLIDRGLEMGPVISLGLETRL